MSGERFLKKQKKHMGNEEIEEMMKLMG